MDGARQAPVLLLLLLLLSCSGMPALIVDAVAPPPAVRIGIERERFVYDDPLLAEKLELLARVNRDRARHGLAELAYDPFASMVGDAHCRRGIEEGTWGHYQLDGSAPYHRFAMAGGIDWNTQNAGRSWMSMPFAPAQITGLALSAHAEMMAEMPPDDGHRRAILDPAHTHVGFGLALVGQEFRMSQEFVNRLLEWTTPLPSRIQKESAVSVRILAGRGWQVRQIGLHHEPPLEPLLPSVVNSRTSYTLPRLVRTYWPRLGPGSAYSDGGLGEIERLVDGSVRALLRLDRGPGIYTVVTWVSPSGSRGGELVPAGAQVVEWVRGASENVAAGSVRGPAPTASASN